MNETTYVTIPVFAAAVGFSDTTVRTWVRNGVIPAELCFRVGRSTRIDLDAARQHITSATPTPSGEVHD